MCQVLFKVLGIHQTEIPASVELKFYQMEADDQVNIFMDCMLWD